MEYRILGCTGLNVSRLGLGCVTFGRELSESESFAIMDHAFKLGINLFDTAEAYVHGCGETLQSSEAIIGRWMEERGCRDQVIVQSKVSAPLTRHHIREAIGRSLDRLRSRRVDVLLLHTFDGGTPLEESLEALAEAREEGLIGAAGCSNFTVEQLEQALSICRTMGLTRLESVEPIYNLANRSIEQDILPFCEREKLGVTAYSPLGAGFLTGKHTGNPEDITPGSRFDLKPGHRRLYYTPEGFDALGRLRRLSEATGMTLPLLAMSWTLRRSDVTSILVGARSNDQLDNANNALQTPFRSEWSARMGLII